MPPFSFDSKSIVESINSAAKDIIGNLNSLFGEEAGATAESIMADTRKQIEKEFQEKLHSIGKTVGEGLFNPLKLMGKTTGKLLKKTFSGPKAQAMGGFMKNMGGMIGAMLGPIGFILKIFEKLGVFEPILEIVNDLIEMLGARILEKMMPSFEQLFDIMLSDEVMTLIDSLADLFVAMIAPIMSLVITLLPVFVAILGPLIRLLAELMPFLTLPSMIIAKLIATLTKLPGFQIAIEAISGAIMIATDAIIWFVDAVISMVNGLMNALTLGLWEDIPTMGSEINEMMTPTATQPVEPISPIDRESSYGTTIYINVDGDISSEETMDNILNEISLRGKLGGLL